MKNSQKNFAGAETILNPRSCRCRAGASPAKSRTAFSSRQHPASDALARQRFGSASDHSELHATRFADHILIPRRIPDELDISLIYAVDRQNLALSVVRDRWPHPAARRSERHFHFHARAAIILFDQTAIVNQTKINNVDRDFGVVALPKLVPDVFI
jgi:hypothetical protein